MKAIQVGSGKRHSGSTALLTLLRRKATDGSRSELTHWRIICCQSLFLWYCSIEKLPSAWHMDRRFVFSFVDFVFHEDHGFIRWMSGLILASPQHRNCALHSWAFLTRQTCFIRNESLLRPSLCDVLSSRPSAPSRAVCRATEETVQVEGWAPGDGSSIGLVQRILSRFSSRVIAYRGNSHRPLHQTVRRPTVRDTLTATDTRR